MDIHQNLLLTIDLGTSGPKVSVYNAHTDLIDAAFAENQLILKENGGAEQAPNDWQNAIKKAYLEIKQRAKFNSKNIKAISVTAQWSNTVPVDENGNPIFNCINWMDARGAKYIEKITDGFLKVDGYDIFKILKWIKYTGGGPSKSGKDPIAHILYLKHQEPEVYNKTYKFLEAKDFLNAWLSGKIVASYDSITLHWLTDNRNIHAITYSDELLKISGIDKQKLPDLVPPNSIIGVVTPEIAQLFDLDENCVVISGSPDTHSAAIGSGAVNDFEPHLYIGTSSWLMTHLPFKKTDLFHNMGAIPSSIPGKYLLANEQECAGANLNFLKNNLFFPKDELNSIETPSDFYKQLDKMAARIPVGSEGLFYLPWIYGERSPVDDHYVRGGLYNLSLHHTRAHVARAVFEGVALNAKWLLKYVEKIMGKESSDIRFIGGGANSALWSQIISDVLNRPILQVKDPVQANSKGAALMAAVALKWINYSDIPQLVQVENTYTPNTKNSSLYAEMFSVFTSIYTKNKAIFSKLNKH